MKKISLIALLLLITAFTPQKTVYECFKIYDSASKSELYQKNSIKIYPNKILITGQTLNAFLEIKDVTHFDDVQEYDVVMDGYIGTMTILNRKIVLEMEYYTYVFYFKN